MVAGSTILPQLVTTTMLLAFKIVWVFSDHQQSNLPVMLAGMVHVGLNSMYCALLLKDSGVSALEGFLPTWTLLVVHVFSSFFDEVEMEGRDVDDDEGVLHVAEDQPAALQELARIWLIRASTGMLSSSRLRGPTLPSASMRCCFCWKVLTAHLEALPVDGGIGRVRSRRIAGDSQPLAEGQGYLGGRWNRA